MAGQAEVASGEAPAVIPAQGYGGGGGVHVEGRHQRRQECALEVGVSPRLARVEEQSACAEVMSSVSDL